MTISDVEEYGYCKGHDFAFIRVGTVMCDPCSRFDIFDIHYKHYTLLEMKLQ